VQSSFASLIAASSLVAGGAVLLAPSLACDPIFNVCVTVRSCSTGAPLSGVHVDFYYDPGSGFGSPGETDSQGRYCTGDMGSTSPPSSYGIDTGKSGYQDATFSVDGGRSDSEVCLKPLACIPQHTESCACDGGAPGTQVCNEEGTAFGPCTCAAAADAD
jgi:hypothetical protein